MEITGRITKDAVVTQLKDERKVTNFSVVINDYYKSKNAERKQTATYFNCSYWMNSAIAQYLKKGALVKVSGRVGVQTYLTKQGETKAALTFHVNSIKLHSSLKSGQETVAVPERQGSTANSVSEVTEPAEDLPF